MTTTISITAVAAVHEVASTLEGYRDPVVLDLDGAQCVVNPLGPYVDQVELRLAGPRFRTASVTIERARRDSWGEGELTRSRVSWGSSSSGSKGHEDAVATAVLLTFAAQVAALIDDWAERGQLSRLAEATS